MILRRVFLATSALLSVLCSFSSFSEDQMPGQSYWVLQRQIRESFEQHDYTAALEKLREADRTVPGDPNVIFRMAVAYTRVGQPESGLQQVKRLVQMGTFFDLRQEKAFADFLNKPKFQQLVVAMEKIRTSRKIHAKVAFRIADSAFLPEGIAYDAKTRDIFVASVHRRKIVRLDSQGKLTDFIRPGQDDIWSISGIAIDGTSRLLWACSTAFEASEGFTPGTANQAAVYAFNLDTGRVQGRFPLQAPGGDHFCDGVAIGADGTLFVADSAGLAVYRLSPSGHQLRTLVPPAAGISPQGLALSKDGTTLFVSNYLNGLYAVELSTSKVSLVKSGAKESLAGIDGLLAYGKDLIAIQNGIQPARVSYIKMSPDQRTVCSVGVMEINHPLFGEPTLGVIIGHTMLFVANNPIQRFLKTTQQSDLPEPVILKMGLR